MEETMVKFSETKSVNTSPEDTQANAQENEIKKQSASETDASKTQTKEQSASETDATNLTSSESSESEPITESEAKEEKSRKETDVLETKLEANVVQQSEGSKENDEEVVIPADTTTPTSVRPEDSEETRSVPVDVSASSESSSQNTPKPAIVGNDKKRSESSASTTTPQVTATRPSDINYDAQPLLLSLPIDSLHTVASFLLPSEWASFGECNKGASRICKEIFRRVRMHGFRCATEVVTAWKLGQHADARELCALYIEAGVPIYPHSLGHSYHTLIWRIGIESREMHRPAVASETNEGGAQGENNEASGARRPIDRFFAERYEARAAEGYSFALSYLEEKSLYLLNREAEAQHDTNSLASSIRRQMSLLTPNRFVVRPAGNLPQVQINGNEAGIAAAQNARIPLLRLPSTGFSTPSSSDGEHRGVTRSNSHQDIRLRAPKVMIKVHRHLLDQHLLGRPSVDDNDGIMTTSTVSLSADFFHPHFSIRSFSPRHNLSAAGTASHFTSSDGFVSGELLPAWNHQTMPPRQAMDIDGLGSGVEALLENRVAVRNSNDRFPIDGMIVTDDSDSDVEPTVVRQVEDINENIFERANIAMATDHQQLPAAPENLVSSSFPIPSYPNILSNVDLEVYSASSANPKVDAEHPDSREIRNFLRTRFGVYQRRLDALLAHNDSVGFEECILDFWDEFLPQTANIHYYDRHTPIPRISCLHKFLTKPCPKSIGIVQCEIERIKISSKKKGVNMKGRFFPTYEYRLFIRHRPSESPDGSEPPRKDTVLMMAKNRGRKHIEASGQSTMTASGKKGANNYYLYVPQQEDVDQHYKNVNGVEAAHKPVPNGAGNRPLSRDGSVQLGRLQSNFIGTEFQIFTPQVQKQRNPRTISRSYTSPVGPGGASSDEELGYDSGFSSDNGSPSSRRRKKRFSRLSLRRSRSPVEHRTIVEDRSLETENPAKHALRRSRSSGETVHSRPTRTSRRAIANTADAPDPARLQPLLCEVEDGAITYTANLLGSRPRIMDVCIPRVTREGVAGVEWKKYLNNSDEMDTTSGNRMLNRLKQIQQRMENEEQGRGANQAEAQEPVVDNSDEYSPPEDFGLLALQNRPPWWNIELGSFVLNFGGRVSVASVKNFQLCDRSDQDYIMLQFGRIAGRHSFTMDFQHPLTAVQAFAIAISSLQSKISFG